MMNGKWSCDPALPRAPRRYQRRALLNELSQRVVRREGLEPPHALSGSRTHEVHALPLSYRLVMVDPPGVEPGTDRLKACCSAN